MAAAMRFLETSEMAGDGIFYASPTQRPPIRIAEESEKHMTKARMVMSCTAKAIRYAHRPKFCDDAAALPTTEA